MFSLGGQTGGQCEDVRFIWFETMARRKGSEGETELIGLESLSLSFPHEIMYRILFSDFNKDVIASKRKDQYLILILIPELHLLIIKMFFRVEDLGAHENILWLKITANFCS